MIIEALRWIGFACGLLLVLATWRSIIDTIILPRSITSLISFAAWIVVRTAFMMVVNRESRYERKDRSLALLGPVSLLAALVAWMLLFLMGYTLMFWPLIDGDLGTALRLAGSSFFTLGVASSPAGGPTALEFLAAATGMIVVALQIGYLPTLYGAYNRRETLVTALSTRVGAPAWGPEILARHQLARGIPTLPAFFASWEIWASDIAESHASYPWLMFFRSPDPLHSWVVSLLAVLDAAALYVSLSPDAAPPEARQCLRAGFEGMRSLARIVGASIEEDPRPDAPLDLRYEWFARGVEQMAAVGFPMERTPEQAWPDFQGWRVNYEAAAYALADYVVAVPAPWSGKRSHMTRQEALDVLSNRPRHRTPSDPEGHLTRPTLPFPPSRLPDPD